MRKLTKILFRSMLVISLFAAISYSPTPAGACPPYDRLITYYDNCTSGKTEVGWHELFCGCGSAQSGTQTGLFKVDDVVYCDSSDEVVTYWGRCNYGDPWEQLGDIDACPNHC
ncbi:MAG: hypothetical protein QOF63_694 [Thermoanaerobaculia bacterium]|jgi:hypothetical protein|nr:hypothetical protein [Thermoanaerobaculia bacterium]